MAHDYYIRCRGISVYISFGTEPYTGTLIQHALETGKVVVVPQILDQAATETNFEMKSLLGLMRMRQIQDIMEINTWPLNKFGIREMPQPPLGSVDQDDALENLVDLIVVPGLAFTDCGDRLGRGKGFYDQYLSGLRRFYQESLPQLEPPRTMALVYSEQILNTICTEENDVKIDAIICA
ncbi:unnamed protein product [Rodentolepis nana]|uniref:5-formyltetrahydrofolate cyclo-ligase n=1 Tax=Rodentolepis nana TaxID=102285 RepID=A0A3P7RV62_RODNA|nr:unnamed protein product [Rodentolepis nana]